MKNIRVLIFDCDGVMFDSRQSNISYYNLLLEHFDLPAMTKWQIAYVTQRSIPFAISLRRHPF